MESHKPQPNQNISSRSLTNTSLVLIPSANNNHATSSLSNAATLENISTGRPSASTTTIIINHQKNHHQNQPQQQQNCNTQNLVTQKTNQVSTVLLYNIPIVSLYIEGQERLCLAQISNTLLKQFSYNEIHNRRVALGITCVQCTPVQLEILRRAGAMPVSSRRCGMITRREAERLCKSFLGDNTPPRLPDDFAFNVEHKCSWGCKGSFLPSRYNSSRAKCIKCHYCGMFFSPNKFIFHSHRVGPGDKYVQPDAANFNSWRRHMMLSGQPAQEVIYAWEDVKAMFNGGTRKRLMINNNSKSPLPMIKTSAPNSCSAKPSSVGMNQDRSLDDVNGDALLTNIQKNGNSVNTVTAAAALVGVTAVAVGSTVRPLNLHFQASTSAGLTTESSYSVGADMHLIPAAALSRSFMMDYMWQHAHQAAKNTYNQQYQHHQPQHKIKSGTSAFTLPWINATINHPTDIYNPESDHTNITYPSSANTNWSNSASTNITRNLSQIINTSAFKPVVYQHHSKKLTETSPLTNRFRRKNSVQMSAYAHDSISELSQNNLYNTFYSSDEDHNDADHENVEELRYLSPKRDDKQKTADNSEGIDDDILVDIETTEDEKPNSFTSNTTLLATRSRLSFTIDNSESRYDIGNNNEKNTASDEDVIDVVHNDNDDTVLEFASLTPLAIIKHTTEDDLKHLSPPSTFTPLYSAILGTREVDKLYKIDRNNSENVPPPALSISPRSSRSRSNESFYIKEKPHYETVSTTNSNSRNTPAFSGNCDDKKINLSPTNQEHTCRICQIILLCKIMKRGRR